jgi:hypothetical protein
MINIQRKPWKFAAVASMLALGFSLVSVTASAAGSIKAAYVEQVIPGTGILGVTSITLTNFDSAAQQVFIFSPVFSGSGICGSGEIIGGGNPQIEVYVQARSTLQLTYPSPMVFNPLNGQTCIAAQVETKLNCGSVAVVVNGFLN